MCEWQLSAFKIFVRVDVSMAGCQILMSLKIAYRFKFIKAKPYLSIHRRHRKKKRFFDK
jgi:hypothetical protein